MTADTAPESPGYTPPMSKLRDDYLEAIAYRGFADLYAAEWDRALAAHDAEVARKALLDAADDIEPNPDVDPEKVTAVYDPYDVADLLRARAEQIGEDRG